MSVKIDYKFIEEFLDRSVNHAGIPLGRPTKAQMNNLRKRFHEWDISIDPYDPFGVYVNFKRKAA